MNSRIRPGSPALLQASGLALAISLIPTGVNAQAAAEPEEEIVVTARRVTESLQDVPLAVTVLGAADLARLQVSDIADLSGRVPNLHVFSTAGANNATAYIRGIGQDNQLYAFEPGVGIYLDDVYMARMQLSLLEALDLERVEVLRGPQGVLYGKNTNGGAIRFVTRDPADVPEGSARVTLGDYGRMDARGMFNAPLGEGVALRGNVLARVRDGYYHNLVDGDNQGGVDLLVGRLSLGLQPTDALDIQLAVDATRDRFDSVFGTPLVETLNPYFGLPGQPLMLSALEPFQANSDMDSLNDQDVWGASLNATWDFGGVVLKSVTGYRDLQFQQNLDLDGHPVPILHSRQRQSSDQFSQELQAQFAVGDSIETVAGVYYFEERSHQTTLTEGLVLSENESELETTSYAAFLSATFALSENWSASAGVRYTRESKDFVNSLSLFGAPLFVGQTGDNEWERWLPSASLEYHFSEATMAYLRYAEGFKSGGFNPQYIGDPNQASFYDEETVATYELGLKTRSGRMYVNLAAFYNDFEDYQAAVSIIGFGGFPVSTFTNAAAYTSYGAELEFFGRLIDQLYVSGSLAYFEGEFDSFINPGTGADLSDNDLANAPEFRASLAAEYSVPLSSSFGLRFGASAAYQTSYFTEVSNTPELHQDAFTLLNAHVALDVGDHVTVELAGRNLTDEHYLTDGFPLDFTPIVMRNAYFGDPRTVTLSVSARF